MGNKLEVTVWKEFDDCYKYEQFWAGNNILAAFWKESTRNWERHWERWTEQKKKLDSTIAQQKEENEKLRSYLNKIVKK